MYLKTQLSWITLLFVCCLLAPSLPAMAQETKVQSTTSLTATGNVLNTNETNAPSPEEIADKMLAADQDFQNKGVFANSLSAEQRTAFANIVAQHQPKLEAIAKQLQDALAKAAVNKAFLPVVASDDGQASAAVQSNTGATTHQAAQADAQITQAIAQAGSIQNTINQELAALLNPEQQVLFEKVGFVQAPQMAGARGIQDVDGTQNSTNCYYGAYYGSVAAYWAWYAEYYAWLDYYYVNNAYSYNDWYYNYYGKAYAYSGTLYAGGAYALSLTQNPDSWDNTAYSEFGNARYYSYWGRYYAYYAWQAGSGYAYYAYVYADYAYYYEGLAQSNIYYCSN